MRHSRANEFGSQLRAQGLEPAGTQSRAASSVRRVRVAIGQIAPRLGALEPNLQLCLAALERAAAAGCALVVLPECALSGYMFGSADQAAAAAEPLPGAASGELVAACGRLRLSCALGLLERAADGALHNSVGYVP
jgi:predicted amidohydrolase